MLNLINIFKTTTPSKPIQNKKLIDQTYKYWRLHILLSMYVGYASFYLTRKSFNFAMPDIMLDLGLNKIDIGILATLFYITYGFSKFISGILSDYSNPRYFMGIGLICTGIINILFGFSSSFTAFAILWGFNAFFQGWGWPPCSTLLTHWYSRSERGSWWSIWNTAHNLGGAIIPISVGFFTVHYGWRYGMWIPGMIAILVGFFLCFRLRDKPSSMGLPSVGAWRNDLLEKKHEKNASKISWSKILTQHVLGNRLIWLLGLCSILVYIIRTAVTDWGNLFLTETYHYDLVKANSAVSLFEVGGLLGSLTAGWGSDYIFRGERGPMNFIFSIGVLLASIFLWMQLSSNYIVQASSFFLLGFFIFGPQMLLGLAAAECSHKHASGAATGFIGLFSYAGAALAGYPVAKILEYFHWHGFFILIVLCSGIASFTLLPFIRLKNT
ncbi:MAG: MFS transporter [Endozoicomonadaceae bacterium]|nr:MFS transporter [Endozoicomonadaceae bacterium]